MRVAVGLLSYTKCGLSLGNTGIQKDLVWTREFKAGETKEITLSFLTNHPKSPN